MNCIFIDENDYAHIKLCKILLMMHVYPVILIMINVKLTPSGLWWTAYLFVRMGKRRVFLVIALLLVSACGSGASSFMLLVVS